MTTQTRRPWRATVRTVWQALVGLCLVIPTLVDAIGLDRTVPVVAGVLAVAAGVTRVMAVPAVEAWLRSYLPWLAADTHDPID